MRRVIWSAATVVGLLLVGATSASAQPVKRGEVFPNFSEPDFRTGKRINLEDFRGKVVLIDFWASWCGPCKMEIPNIKKLYEKYHAKGFEVISISLDQGTAPCKEYVEKEKMDWYHICDGNFWKAKLAVKHGVQGIPKAYLIGRDGKVVSEEARGGELDRALEEALAAKYEDVAVDDAVEKEAKAALAKADDLKKKGEYAEALKLYDEIGLKYAGRPTAKLANERARLLREDPDVQGKLKPNTDKKLAEEAAKQGEQWLKVAREMAASKNYDSARKFYQKVIDKFPGTQQAKTAKEELDKLPK